MIIYKCIITDDEMFSDIYKIKDTGIFFEVEGKGKGDHGGKEGGVVQLEGHQMAPQPHHTVTRTEGFDDALIGANASSEEVTESSESSSVSGVDIVLNHKLSETTFDKKSYMSYIKEYMKAVKAKLQETNPDRVEKFMAEVQPEVKKILGNISNYQFFTGESMNPDGMVGLLDYREDGITPFMIFFKDGLLVEKC